MVAGRSSGRPADLGGGLQARRLRERPRWLTSGINGQPTGFPLLQRPRGARERDLLSSSGQYRTNRLIVVAGVLALVLPALYGWRAIGAAGLSQRVPMSQEHIHAPELAGGVGWFNVDKPLTFRALRGKVVLLDFWTYGCINCLHIIPDLKRLEAKYANELVVIGVHSAKFTNERETENLRRIIVRYGIEHPVVNDAAFKIWNAYGIHAWPTRVLIDPEGYIAGGASGEGNFEAFDHAIATLAEEFKRRGELDETPITLALERATMADLPLSFPGKVLADEAHDRLYIADSNHNRIVVATLAGQHVETLGSGEIGAEDGPFERATFNRPQGMALEGGDPAGGGTLYVADTENHLIRAADLRARTVRTVAGTGRQAGMEDVRRPARPAREASLSSPWDLALAGRQLFIAMAGVHQIWMMDLERGTVGPYAGSGREARLDGKLSESGFAQPSGLTIGGETLFVADPESNIIRAVDLPPGDRVRTLVGGDLFDFGDTDGRGDEVRLQHSLGVVWVQQSGDGRVFIADTYNHKIKALAPESRTVMTFAGTGSRGEHDGGASARFYEPGGITYANGKLYVADTNNHAIRTVDVRTREVAMLPLTGVTPPPKNLYLATPAQAAAATVNEEKVTCPLQRLRASSDGELLLEVRLPDGYHLNPYAMHRYRVDTQKAGAALSFPQPERSGQDLQLPLHVPFHAGQPGGADLAAMLHIAYCRTDQTGTCFIKTLRWEGKVDVVDDAAAPTTLRLQATVK